MKLNKVSYSLRMKINLPGYNSVDLEAGCEMLVEDTGNQKQKLERSNKFAQRVLLKQLQEVATTEFLAKCKGVHGEASRVWCETTEEEAAKALGV